MGLRFLLGERAFTIAREAQDATKNRNAEETMSEMRAMQIVEFDRPLQLNTYLPPKAKGSEVVVRIQSAGVCHSDLHIWEGFFDLGQGQRIEMASRGMKLPHTLGHEIAGEVVDVGPDAKGAKIGQRAVVFPWIGCGTCAACLAGDELLCPAPRTLGTRRDGGYATHVVVPDAKYLVDYGNCPQSLACTYACSGLTAYSAIRKAQQVKNMKKLLVMGAGGLGLAALEVAKAIHDGETVVADIDDAKLAAARDHGATKTVNVKGDNAVAALMEASGGTGFDAAIDFVGAPGSYRNAYPSVRRGGKLVMVGLFGSDTPLSLASLPLRMMTIEGSYVGSLGELNELMALARAGKIGAMPYSERPLEDAADVLYELRGGKVIGRVVLKP
jgi:D-arabinose 1-dehydrogenase-like Zn-dependent alcohol dehydrogenase